MTFIVTDHAVEQFVARCRPALSTDVARMELFRLLQTSRKLGPARAGGDEYGTEEDPGLRFVLKHRQHRHGREPSGMVVFTDFRADGARAASADPSPSPSPSPDPEMALLFRAEAAERQVVQLLREVEQRGRSNARLLLRIASLQRNGGE